MKINFTKKQYQRLVELIYLGDFVANGYKEIVDEDFDELVQYIYSFSKEMESQEYVEYDKGYDRYFETKALDDEMMEIIDEYIEKTFLDSFIDKATIIAFQKKYGNKKDDMGIDESIEKMEDIREKVTKYLDEEGIDKAIAAMIDKI